MYQVENRFKDTSDAGFLELRVMVLESRLFDAIQRAGGVGKISTYEQMKKVVGTDTLAFNVTLGNYVAEVLKAQGAYFGFDALFAPETKEDQPNWYSSDWKVPDDLAIKINTEAVLNQVKTFLAPPLEEKGEALECISGFHIEKPDDTVFYKIHQYQENVYIAVEEGFLRHMEAPASRKAFFSDILKAGYAVARINSVNRCIWFVKYVEALLGASV